MTFFPVGASGIHFVPDLWHCWVMAERTPLVIRAVRIGVGTLLVLIGIVGIFMPILPGWLLIIPGLALLGREFIWANRLECALRSRFAEARRIGRSRRSDQDDDDIRSAA